MQVSQRRYLDVTQRLIWEARGAHQKSGAYKRKSVEYDDKMKEFILRLQPPANDFVRVESLQAQVTDGTYSRHPCVWQRSSLPRR